MRQEPVPVVVSFPLTEQTRATIEGASPLVRILDYASERVEASVQRPPPTSEQRATLAQAEVLFGSHLDSIELHRAAPNLKWFQVLTAGLDELLEQGVLDLDFTITTMSGVGAVPIAEYCMGVMVMLEKGLHQTMRDQVEHPLGLPDSRGSCGGRRAESWGWGRSGGRWHDGRERIEMRVIATRRSAQGRRTRRGCR